MNSLHLPAYELKEMTNVHTQTEPNNVSVTLEFRGQNLQTLSPKS